MNTDDLSLACYEINNRPNREKQFIGGIQDAADTDAQILGSVIERLMVSEQLSAATVVKSDPMEGYLVGSRSELQAALVRIPDSDVQHDAKLRGEPNIMGERLKAAHGELSVKLNELAVQISTFGNGGCAGEGFSRQGWQMFLA